LRFASGTTLLASLITIVASMVALALAVPG